jgi:carbon storage regulator CsrA
MIRNRQRGNLLLTRCVGDGICIDEDITIIIRAMRDDIVQLAISAPREMKIDRLECRLRPKKQALASPPDGEAAEGG